MLVTIWTAQDDAVPHGIETLLVYTGVGKRHKRGKIMPDCGARSGLRLKSGASSSLAGTPSQVRVHPSACRS
jgi:hypothetical protein